MIAIRALIVDDEEPARELLRSFLSRWPEVQIVGEAGEGGQAIEMIRRLSPDLVFLDVQMPGMTGFAVVAELSPDEMPLVVFVTAHDQYALRAFEVSACDYLLKPFDADRLASTIQRVFARREQPGVDMREALRSLIAHTRQRDMEQIVVKADGRHIFLWRDDIEWIEAIGKDVCVHTTGAALTVRESLTSLQERIDPHYFVRVHRSALINRRHLREMQPWFKGAYVLIMRSGARIVTGRTFRANTLGLVESG